MESSRRGGGWRFSVGRVMSTKKLISAGKVLSVFVALLMLAAVAAVAAEAQVSRAQPGGQKGDQGSDTPSETPSDTNPKSPENKPRDKPSDDSGKKAPSTKPSKKKAEEVEFPVLQYKLKDVKGGEIDLMQFKGKVLLLVPVAWDDRNRREFADFKAIASHYKENGFAVVAVLTPSFTKGESRTDAELHKMIEERYGITYMVAESVSTKGDDIHPLFKYLTAESRGEKLGGELQGAFTKFLISRDGTLVRRFEPGTRMLVENYTGPIWRALETPMSK